MFDNEKDTCCSKGANEFCEMELIFNSTQDALFLILVDDGKFRYLRSNKRHGELTGYRTEELTGRTVIEVLGEEIGSMQDAYCRKCVSEKETITFEETFDFKGVHKEILTKLTPLIQKGHVTHIVGSRVDITPVKNIMHQKEEMLNQFMTLFNTHTAIMMLIDPDDGQIKYANPAACSFYGYDKEEMMRMKIQEINQLQEATISEQMDKARERQQKYFVFPHRLKDGRIRYVDVYSCPVKINEKRLLYSIIFDVTEREENKAELFREKEMLKITLNSIGDGVVTTDTNGCLTGINKAAEDILLWKNDEVVGKKFNDVFVMKSEITGERNPDIVDYVLKSGNTQELANHTVLLDREGNYTPIADSVAPIVNRQNIVCGAVMVFRDVSEEKEKKKKILYLSYHDTLTGLYNRRYFDDELKKIDREENYPLAILMGDVNGLKMTNDVFGHEFGDRLLKTIAQTIKGSIGDFDIAIRWGGDEFVILLPKSSEEIVEALIERIKIILKHQKINDIIDLSVSFGYSFKNRAKKPIDLALQEAEEMMYRMKMTDSKSLRSSIVNTTLATLYENSSETKEHADRLWNYCKLIGKTLKLKYEALSELELLSVLHDIGKVGISQQILMKKGSLDADEWREMRRHSEIGYRIALNVPELSSVAEYILYHHEKWDGTGYPQGLEAEDIPLNCRILAVVDAYDAMVHDRVYRKAMKHSEAVEELKRFAGSQFDPKIVDSFIKILSNNKDLA